MTATIQVAAILFFTITLSVCAGCVVDDVAVYKVTLQTLWSEERFPKDYPLYRPNAQWSQLFGQSHNESHTLYRVNEVAKSSVLKFSQFGHIEELIEESEDDVTVYDQFSAPAISAGEGKTENMVFVDGAHSLVSAMCRIVPSPDWFVGVDSLNLCVNSGWIEQVTLDLEPLDAGAASGLTFTAPRWETSPPAAVSRHGPKSPSHPSAGFYYPELKSLPAIAKIEFTKVKEYSTKQLNDLARKEVIENIKTEQLQQAQKQIPTIYRNEEKNDLTTKGHKKIPTIYPTEEINDFTTKNNLEILKDLEEDSIGTSQANLSDNIVEVVTKKATIGKDLKRVRCQATRRSCMFNNIHLHTKPSYNNDRTSLSTTTTTTTESEFDPDLHNMDEVVLAVAHGKKLGLGKHLPRHFRSRLHHAINKLRPNDCLVSDWTEWTPCSTTCGFGDKFRTRSILREPTLDGRRCPELKERTHCGNVNSCYDIEYFDW